MENENIKEINLTQVGELLKNELGSYGRVISQLYFPNTQTNICAVIGRYSDENRIEEILFLVEKKKFDEPVFFKKIDSIYVSTDYEDDSAENEISLDSIVEMPSKIVFNYTKFFAGSAIQRYRPNSFELNLENATRRYFNEEEWYNMGRS